MKYIVFITILFGCSLDVLAQEDINPDGYNVFYYPDGKKSSEGNLKNGKPNGYWITYFKNGKLKSEGNRVDFLLDSTWKFYNEKGYMVKEVNYLYGLKHGDLNTYNDSGEIISVQQYLKDTLNGITKTFYNNGRLKETVPYEQGVREGIGKSFAYDEDRLIGITVYIKGSISSSQHFNRKDNAGRKQGKWMWFFTNDKLRKEANYKNDVLHGYTKYYNENGQLDSAALYINGVRQTDTEELMVLDLKKEYYDDGTVKSEGPYNLNGEKHGTFKIYNKQGELVSSKFYRRDIMLEEGEIDEQGRRQGEWKAYYLDGALKSKGSYKNDLKTGEWQFYYQDSTLEQKGTYAKGGKLNGEWVWYHPNGQIWRKENFRKGLEDGMSEEYMIDGKLITKGEYIDGKKEGPWFYEMGDHREEGSYREGNRNGEWIYHYRPSDILNFQGSYIDGEPDGEHIYYYPNGKVRLKGKYEIGMKQGIWKEYDELGMEFISILYKNDEVIKIGGAKVKQVEP